LGVWKVWRLDVLKVERRVGEMVVWLVGRKAV
jgi:hypothetical protein